MVMERSFLGASVLSALTMLMVDAVLVKQAVLQHTQDAPLASGSLVPTAENDTKASGFLKVPTGQVVAVLLRGETFRYNFWDATGVKHRKSCAKESVETQMATVQSILENIVEPFERNGNRVEILLTSVNPLGSRLPSLIEFDNKSTFKSDNGHGVNSGEGECPLDNMIVKSLQAPHRPVTFGGRVVSNGQADTMMQVKDMFEKTHGGVDKVIQKFHQIVILRNDLYWFKPLDEIRASFDNINFLAGCVNGCIHDSAFFVPGFLYSAIDACFGKVATCFLPKEDPVGCGHGCLLYCLKDKLSEFGHHNAYGFFEMVDRRVRGAANVAHPGVPNGHVADLTDVKA